MTDTQSTLDTLLQLEDGAAAITSTETNSGGILDVGTGVYYGDLLVDVSAIDIADDDETYRILLQGSASSSFASGIFNLAELHLGAAEIKLGGADDDSAVGRYRVPFHNFIFDETTLRYLRSRVVVGGTSPSITYTANLVRRKYG
jgi:hypothetical protein